MLTDTLYFSLRFSRTLRPKTLYMRIKIAPELSARLVENDPDAWRSLLPLGFSFGWAAGRFNLPDCGIFPDRPTFYSQIADSFSFRDHVGDFAFPTHAPPYTHIFALLRLTPRVVNLGFTKLQVFHFQSAYPRGRVKFISVQ